MISSFWGLDIVNTEQQNYVPSTRTFKEFPMSPDKLRDSALQSKHLTTTYPGQSRKERRET